MKTKFQLILFVLFNLFLTKSYTQIILDNQPEFEGAYPLEINNANNPCITTEQYSIIESRCNENAIQLGIDNASQNSTSAIQLNWPLKAATGFTDCSFYFIAAYVDQDKATSTIKDYNCGTNTYDGHRGTDIAIGPFPFYKMDHDFVEVVVAAGGTILDKHDSEFDKNCVGVASNLTANYVVIQHPDGSRALYWHMKKNSITTKAIGQAVVVGEHLGIVGSSGSSSGPHLHFEIWAGSTVSTLVDPYAGTCNLLNANSWWASQKIYAEPSPIKVSVNITDIVTPACPATETPNESDSYVIPFQGPGLSPGYAKFYTYLRFPTSGTSATMKILNPNSTVFNTWTYNVSTNYVLGYAQYSKLLPTKTGIYTFEATYNGITCSHNFEIINLTKVHEADDKLISMSAYPNPFNNSVIIQWSESINKGKLIVYNELGQNVKLFENISGNEISFNRDNLPSGVYSIRLENDHKIVSMDKLLIGD